MSTFSYVAHALADKVPYIVTLQVASPLLPFYLSRTHTPQPLSHTPFSHGQSPTSLRGGSAECGVANIVTRRVSS
jgi:hypothetical protein